MSVIDSFSGEHEFLSNFHESPVMFEGIEFPTSEHAFQAAKTLDSNERLTIASLKTPGQAKRAGRKVSLRADWESVKFDVMFEILLNKFRNPILRQKLLDTGEVELIESNTWGDVIWGVCKGIGDNHLGKTLMKVRFRYANLSYNQPN